MEMATKSLISLIGSNSKSKSASKIHRKICLPVPHRHLSLVRPIRIQYSTIKARSYSHSHSDSPPDHDFTFTEKDLESEESLRALFERWSSHYRFTFPTATDEDRRLLEQKFDAFKKSARYVHELQKQGCSWVGLNNLAATTDEEMKMLRGTHISPRPRGGDGRR